MNLKIAIQGIQGSNHHQVAKDYFGENIDLVECLSFDFLVDQLLKGVADKGIMAIENSIAGSIIPNYNLIYHNGLHIIGEHYLSIHHNLMVLKGQSIDDIEEVRSHPMALLQCKEFFKQYPHIKLVEDVDTAETAKRIQEEQLKNIAAIAPNVAAELYDLNIVAPDIQTIANNATRFIIVKTRNKELPIIETPWKYAFFVDVTFEGYENFDKAKSLLNIMSEDFKVLGEYKNARL